MSKVLPRAKQHLKRYEGFLPFGGVLKSNDEIQIYVGSKAGEPADFDKVVLEVASGLRLLALRGEARAVCLVVLVRTVPPGRTEKTDAIWIRIEHPSGVSKSMFYPYNTLEGGEVEFHEPVTVPESPKFYTPP